MLGFSWVFCFVERFHIKLKDLIFVFFPMANQMKHIIVRSHFILPNTRLPHTHPLSFRLLIVLLPSSLLKQVPGARVWWCCTFLGLRCRRPLPRSRAARLYMINLNLSLQMMTKLTDGFIKRIVSKPLVIILIVTKVQFPKEIPLSCKMTGWGLNIS